MTPRALRACLATLAAAGTLSRLAAQTTAPASPTPSEAVQMEKFNVSDVPVDQVILPNARPFTSVFGTDDNIVDVPRNVTIISRSQMDTIGIQEVTDFSKLTSSSYTDSNFGAPGNPSIRGQSADIFANGMRQRVTSNGNGAPLDFNEVESVNIVKGPATAVQGASGYVGGFADLVTKQPFFDAFKGSVSYTIGSYGTNRWTADVGGPIAPTLAYRFSYSGEWSNEWWDGAFKHVEAAYGAITWKPSNDYTLAFNAKIFIGKYSENFGIDRPTQNLISNGQYQTGININNGAGVAPSDSQNSLYVIGGFGSNTVAWGPTVPVNYHWRLQGPGSESHAHEYNAQMIQTLNLGPTTRLVNNTFFSLTQRDTFGTHYYSEIIAPTAFIENRTEFIHEFDTFLKGSVVNMGLAEYYQHTKAYDDFYFEPANVWDLSRGRAGLAIDSINFPLTPNSAGYFPGAPLDVAVPGWAGRYATESLPKNSSDFGNNSDTNESALSSLAPFFQANWKLQESLSLVTGARVDVMEASVTDPLNVGRPTASIHFNEPNFNASLIYKITPVLSTYATWNHSENYTGALANGGGVTGWGATATALNPYLSKEAYEEPSELYEAGFKGSLLNNQLFFSSAVFEQTRDQKTQGQPAVAEKFHGFEVEANYQPNKHLYATLGYSLLVGSLGAPTPFQGYSTNQVPGGPPDATQLTGKLRVPGYPLDTITGLVSYTMDSGLGASANIVITSPMNNDYDGYLVIPWQYTLDASVFYKKKIYEVRLSVTNLTNQHNWTPAYPTYGLESIVPDPGIEGFLTIKRFF